MSIIAQRPSPASHGAAPVDRVPSHDHRLLGWGLVAVAAGLAANSVVGPFGLDRIDYPVSASMRSQTIGLDAASLLIVAPLALVVGWLALRRRPVAPIFALGIAGYVAYMFVQFVVGPDHLHYHPALLLQLGLFTAGWLLAVVAWREGSGDRSVLPRRHAVAALALGGFVLLRYLPGLVGSLDNQPIPDDVAADPAMYWLILLLDVGLYLPATTIAAAGLARRARWATQLHRALIVWFALTTLAVASMSLAMLADDDPNASAGLLAMFVALGIGVSLYASLILRAPSSRRTSPGAGQVLHAVDER